MAPVIELTDAAFYYDQKEHQQYAWHWLQDQLTVAELEQFATLYRKVEPKVQGIVTPELMHKLTGYRASSFNQLFCDDANRLFHETGFDKHPQAQAMLMANMMHETCNFVYMKEIASGEAYNNRSDLGNGPHDGPKYKGAGVLQLTGKYNYQNLADDINDPKVMQGVDYVADTYPFMSAKSWIERNDLLNVCLNQGFEACCVRINGGHNGYTDRCHKYEICKREMT